MYFRPINILIILFICENLFTRMENFLVLENLMGPRHRHENIIISFLIFRVP